MSYPQRQAWRYWAKAAAWILASAVAAGVSAQAWALGFSRLAVVFLVGAGGCVCGVRYCTNRARRNQIGASSERTVARRLRPLRRDGWKVENSIPWAHNGDIDHLAISPDGVAFVIETKTVRFTDAHLDRTRLAAAWLAGRRRGVRTAVPILCVGRSRGRCELHRDVLVCSPEMLVDVLVHMRTDPAPAPPETLLVGLN